MSYFEVPKRICSAEVRGLFGAWIHTVRFREGSPTILTAPNGAGKTHILMLIRAVVSLDAKALFGLPFEQVSIDLSNSVRIKVSRSLIESSAQLVFSAYRHGAQLGSDFIVREGDILDDEKTLPSYIRQMPDGRWLDRRSERIYSTLALERRFNIRFKHSPRVLFAEFPEILACVKGVDAALIDTQRLNSWSTVVPEYRRDVDVVRSSMASIPGMDDISSIGQYIGEIRSQIVEARRDSVAATQNADFSFAVRALASANNTVRESNLRKRYEAIAADYQDLRKNGLAAGDAPLEFPEKTTPTVRRILDVFLDDWEQRLAPLLPLNEKIAALRSILDTKLAQSGKSTKINPRGVLEFFAEDRRKIGVANLSSGEQHLVALFTLLLFSASPGSIVLIDEPEISMHAAWKHSFLEDIATVASIKNLQIIIATHSTSIINGKWEIVEELEFNRDPDATQTSTEEALTGELWDE